MRKRLAAATIAALVFLGLPTRAQMTVPVPPPPDGATLFKRQCATCHTLHTDEPMRQGPPLAGIIGRKAGSAANFHYSAGFAKADWEWDEVRIDAWISNPQAMIPGSFMLYKQANAATRRQIIAYLRTAS